MPSWMDVDDGLEAAEESCRVSLLGRAGHGYDDQWTVVNCDDGIMMLLLWYYHYQICPPAISAWPIGHSPGGERQLTRDNI